MPGVASCAGLVANGWREELSRGDQRVADEQARTTDAGWRRVIVPDFVGEALGCGLGPEVGDVVPDPKGVVDHVLSTWVTSGGGLAWIDGHHQ